MGRARRPLLEELLTWFQGVSTSTHRTLLLQRLAVRMYQLEARNLVASIHLAHVTGCKTSSIPFGPYDTKIR